MTDVPELDWARAVRLLAREYDRLLEQAPEDDRQASQRLAALKSVMAQYVEARRRLDAQRGVKPPDLGAMRAAIAQEMPSDDDDDTDDGDAG